MMKRKFVLLFTAAASVAVVAVLTFAVFGGGASDRPIEDTLFGSPNVGAGESVSRSGGSDEVREGIGVKGHWELTVLNADGSVAARHEVQNALTSEGQEILAMILSGERGISRPLSDDGAQWSIIVLLTEGSYSGSCPPGEASAGGEACHPVSAIPSIEGSWYLGDLIAGRDGSTLPLSIETKPFAGPATVVGVKSFPRLCPVGLSSCGDSSDSTLRIFTETDIDPVDIETGQRILVTVTLSFTTG